MKKSFAILMIVMMMMCFMPTAAFADTESVVPTEPPDTLTPVTVDMEKSSFDKSTKEAKIFININNTATDDVEVKIGDVLMELVAKTGYRIMPGAKVNVHVSITNNSKNSFEYTENGLTLESVPGKEQVGASKFIGYDGYVINLLRAGAIEFNHPALKELLGKNPTVGKVATIYTLLKEKGYEGDEALTNYILDYYKTKLGENSLNWDSLYANYRNQFIRDTSTGGFSGLFSGVTEEDIALLESNGFKDAIFVDGYDDDSIPSYVIQLKWPEQKLAAFSYDIFYDDLLAFTFGKEAESANPNSGTAFTRTRGVADYRNPEGEAYRAAESYLKGIGGEDRLLSSDETADIDMAMTLDGPGTGNQYMLYDFSSVVNLSLNFKLVTTNIAVEKIWNDNDNQDGKRHKSVTVVLQENGKDLEGKTLILSDENGWKGSFENLPKYKGSDKIVYTVREEAVEEYTSDIKLSETGVYVITNTHTPKINPPIGPTYTSVSVKKEWKLDDGGTAADSVTVQLYRNGVKYPGGEITLSKGNNWHHIWRPLYIYGDIWTVEEVNVPEGFSSTVTKTVYSNDFTITNDDMKPNPEEPTEPTESEKPIKPDKPTKPDKPAKPAKPDTQVPKTGDMSFEILLISIFALILSAGAGLIVTFRKKVLAKK